MVFRSVRRVRIGKSLLGVHVDHLLAGERLGEREGRWEGSQVLVLRGDLRGARLVGEVCWERGLCTRAITER